jgi:hypothetical protein
MGLDKAAVQTAVAIAALSALVVKAIEIGGDEIKALLAERREKRKVAK